MTHDVYVFGDSHWRVFFPFVNHGAATDNVSHEQCGVRTIDTIANELSGATMYGLLNPNSKNGARNRVLNTIDSLGGVDNVGLVFGEVDARYHNHRYFHKDKSWFLNGRALELFSRYVTFIEEDLLLSGRVRNKVFIYHGFHYPQHGSTLLQPGQPMGEQAVNRAGWLNRWMASELDEWCAYHGNIHFVGLKFVKDEMVSPDGVHLLPELVYPHVSRMMRHYLEPVGPGEFPL